MLVSSRTWRRITLPSHSEQDLETHQVPPERAMVLLRELRNSMVAQIRSHVVPCDSDAGMLPPRVSPLFPCVNLVMLSVDRQREL